MEFIVVYEIPPMRALYSTVINAVDISDAREKVQSNGKFANYRIKNIEEFTPTK